MRRSLYVATAIAVLLSLGVAIGTMAHGGSGEAKIQVEPSSITAGDAVVLAGSGLEPDDERILVLAGVGFTVDLGTATTDAEGMFSIELKIPSHLPSGNYELRAIGDETLTVPLGVTATAGGGQASPAPNDAADKVVARDRTPIELGLIIGLTAAASLVGAWLVLRAERFRGAPTA